MRPPLSFFLLVLFAACADTVERTAPAAAPNEAKPPAKLVDVWRGELAIPGGAVQFDVEISRADELKGGLAAVLRNGPDRIPFTRAEWNDPELVLALDQYDGAIRARLAGDELRGDYSRTARDGVRTYPFVARIDRTPVARLRPAVQLGGEWLATFAAGKEQEVAPLVLEQSGAEITGTVAHASGDDGLLAGRLADRTLTLFRFDGIHVIRMDGTVSADGTLVGIYHSGSSSTPFTAVRPAAQHKAPAAVATRMRDPDEPLRWSFPDFDGRVVSSTDERFRGKVVIVTTTGSWCPNCHDEAPLLVDLWKRYRDQGLEIVALGFEYTDDAARSTRMLKRFAAMHGIEYPVLLAGSVQEGSNPTVKLPQVEGYGAYPTTFFVGRDGRVREIHAGFQGPATGRERHAAQKRHIEETVVKLIAEPSPELVRE